MNSRNTFLWLALAAGLFAFIFFFERHLQRPETGPPRVLPGLRAAAIQNLQILPKGQLAIHAVRTNQAWTLTEPLVYPAEARRIQELLATLEDLTALTYLSGPELKGIPDADEQFGFSAPQFSLMLGHRQFHVLIGHRTPPGDGVYVQVVGTEGVFIADAELLKLLPKTANDWRDPALIEWNRLRFDRLVVTNAGKSMELRLSPTNGWRMIAPINTRADNGRVREAFQQLVRLQTRQFITDEPRADLDSYGLQTPEANLSFYRDTNLLVQLDFGKSPTNDAALVYARRTDASTIVTVPKAAFEPLTFSRSHDFRDFLDPHLIALTAAPDQIEVHGEDRFILQRQPDQTWTIAPAGWLADSNLLVQVLANLTNLQVTAAQIVKDVVPAAALPDYGLASPFRQYVVKSARAEAAGITTNLILAQLDFGTNQGNLYARVPGEGFVYAIDPAMLALLPSASWQMRDRRVWNFSEEDVVSLTIRQGAKIRGLIRKGPKHWGLAGDSQGIMDEILSAQIEESVHRLGDLTANFWVQRGGQDLEGYGFKEAAYRLDLELKDGTKHTVTFGKEAPSRFPYAAVPLQGETWVFEFPWSTYQFLQMYLTIPANVP